MKHPAPVLFGLLIWFTTHGLTAQDSLAHRSAYPEGLSVEYGIGSYAHTDEYISKEKYSGTLPFYRIVFARQHDRYVYHVGIEFWSTSDLRNHNVNATVYHFSLDQGFLYRLPQFSLFSKRLSPYVGPSIEIFVYSNKQHIAVSGFDYAQSIAGLLSVGLSSELMGEISSRFHLEGALNFSVLSLGARSVDMEETDESPVKALTLFSGLHGSLRLGGRYDLMTNMSVRAAYLLDITRISAWEPLHAASDNLVFTITYGL